MVMMIRITMVMIKTMTMKNPIIASYHLILTFSSTITFQLNEYIVVVSMAFNTYSLGVWIKFSDYGSCVRELGYSWTISWWEWSYIYTTMCFFTMLGWVGANTFSLPVCSFVKSLPSFVFSDRYKMKHVFPNWNGAVYNFLEFDWQ